MFENLTQREKTMAVAVLCMLPLLLIFGSWTVFNGKYQDAKTRLQSLDNNIKTENQKALDAMSAGTRLGYYYERVSFPSGPRSVTRYQDWLEKLIRDCGMGFKSIGRPKTSKFTFRSESQGVGTIGKKLEFGFDATGKLDQIMQFCFDFEQVDLLHKIKNLTIIPSSETGNCKANFDVELLVLDGAVESRDFLALKRELPRTLDEYKQIVVSRNIFGPANNAPTLSLSRKTFNEGDEISFSISGRDSDGDELTYELLDNGGIEGAKLELKGKRTYFECPALEIGEYEIEISVSDDGLPSKSAEKVGKIVVKAPRKAKEEVVEVKPKPINARHTLINRISWRDGEYDIKIGVRLTGEVFELKVGDEFELDEKKWIVKDIQDRKVTLETDGRILEYKQKDRLSEPRKETRVAGAEAVGVKDDVDNSADETPTATAVDTEVGDPALDES